MPLHMLIRVLWISAAFTLVSSVKAGYPAGSLPCKLHNYINMDCSKRQLTEVPSLNCANVKSLDLSQNKISKLKSDSFINFHHSLQTLLLGKNELRNLGGNSPFVDLVLLTILDISSNKVKSISDETFHGLTSLIILDLSDNLLTEIHGTPFQHMWSLQKLDLSHSGASLTSCWWDDMLSHLAPSVFRGLTNLTTLDVSCNAITMLSDGIFDDLRRLKYLDLSYNMIEQISTKPTNSARILNISNNAEVFYNLSSFSKWKKHVFPFFATVPLETLEMTMPVLDGESDKGVFETLETIKELKVHILCNNFLSVTLEQIERIDSALEHLLLSRFEVEQQLINNATFHSLRKWNVSLTYLEIMNSEECYFSLKRIENYTFMWFPNLVKLTISRHPLSQLLSDTFSGLDSLQELDLSNNELVAIPQDAFTLFSSLKYLDLSNNKIEGFGANPVQANPILCMPSLEEFHIGGNTMDFVHLYPNCLEYSPLRVINFENIWTVYNQISEMSLVFLSFSKIPLVKIELAGYKTEPGRPKKAYFSFDLFNDLNKQLEYVDLHDWYFDVAISSVFANFSKLEYLDICGSNLYDYTYQPVYWPHLESLKVAHNKINDSSEIAFMQTPSLKMLDLSHNLLNNFGFEYASSLINLTNLNLESNQLVYLGWFNELPSVQILVIGSNFVSDVTEEFLTKAKQLLKLDISNNQYDCSRSAKCALAPFTKWITKDKFTLLVPNQMYQCFPPQFHSEPISITSLNLAYCKYLPGIYVGSSLAILFVVTIVVYVLYRYRWHIKYKFFLLFRRRHYRREISLDEADVNSNEMRYLAPIHFRRFDAYVIFTPQDKSWVNDQLVANIEDGPQPFELCMKERGDIPPGRPLLNAICHGITHSRRTIAVLSKQFMTDGMCNFQLEVAYTRLIKEGRDVLILVFLEDIPDVKLTMLMRQILCNCRAVLKWPEGALGRDLFWQTLREELKRPVQVDRRYEVL